jgi:hypothetical protein
MYEGTNPQLKFSSFVYSTGVDMTNLRARQLGLFVFILGHIAMLFGCGSKPKGKPSTGPAVGQVESAFLKASRENKIPVRILMATGYLESQLVPQMALANYVSIGSDEPSARGTIITETAFAQTYATLGLDPAKDESQILEVQIDAYAKWLRAKIDNDGLSLNENPVERDDLFYWIQLMSRVQRNGLEGRQNVQILFAKELIEVLNNGFVWQNQADSKETITFQPEAKKIEFTDFSQNGQNFFTLTELNGRFYGAKYIPLATVTPSDIINKPKRVMVVHCPLSLSACLELQTRNEESDVNLAAHYIIPQDDSVFSDIIQVADHHEAVIVTNSAGEDVPVTDSIVVMLVGSSGRNISGRRIPANPTWFTHYQLERMRLAIDNICTLLAAAPVAGVEVNREQCMAFDGDSGLYFRSQGPSEEYRWGDIADYDRSIFQANFRSTPKQSVAFEFQSKNRIFQAGQNIPLLMHVGPDANDLTVERLARCNNGKVVWVTVRNRQVFGETKVTLDEILHDAGPNDNGEHFFRMKVFGRDGLLTGWAVDKIHLQNYKNKSLFASEEQCAK